MRKLIDYFSKKGRFYLFLLVFVATLSHREWFLSQSVLTFSDWYYWPSEVIRWFFVSWGTWVNFWNFGLENIQINFNLFGFIWSTLSFLGFSYDIATKITFFIPIAILGFLSPFFLFRRLVRSDLVAFVAALFYGTTTYFLIKQTGHLPIALLYSLFPLLFLFFLRALDSNKLLMWLQFTLLFWLISTYEIRIAYIIFLVLVFYFLLFHVFCFRKYLKNIFVSSAIFILLNAFWLIPAVFGSLGSEVQKTANRGLFGDNLFSMSQAFALFESSWTGGYPDMNFYPQPIPMYLWVIPIFIFSAFFAILFSKNSGDTRRKVMFFGAISLVGVFLTKQSGQPLGSLYEWLYFHFPGFNLFREASKFYLLTAFGYSGLLAYGLLYVKSRLNNQKLFPALCILISCLSLWNLKPLVTGEIGTLFVSRHVPTDYVVLSKYLEKESEKDGFFRTFWSPVYSRWGYYDNQHPKVSNVEIIQSNWNALTLGYKLLEKLPNEERVIDIFSRQFADQLFDISSVRYVIIPLQDIENDDDFFKYYGDRDFFIQQLDKIAFLDKIDIGTTDIVVYENAGYRSHIYVTRAKETIHQDVPFESIDFQFRNPAEYSAVLKNLAGPVYVNFSEKYHSGWSVRVGKFDWFDVLAKEDYFLSEKYHTKNDAELNSFLIDPEYIKKNFSKDQYRENPDGSIDLDLTLYFKSQSYFYLGLIVSGLALAGCLGYLGYATIANQIRSRNNRKSL